MAKTPISNPDSYLSPSEFLAMVTPQVVRQWVSVDGDDVDLDDLEVNEALLMSLRVASGWVEAAAFHAGTYTADDLAVLTGNGKALLGNLIAKLAIKNLLQFRAAEYDAYRNAIDEANEVLKSISEGVMIFGLQEAADAGVLDHEIETPAQIEALNLASVIAMPLFGRRTNRYPRS